MTWTLFSSEHMMKSASDLMPLIIVALTFFSVFCIVVAIPGIFNTGFIGRFRARNLEQMALWHRNLFYTAQTPKEHMAMLEWGCALVFILCLLLTRNLLVAVILVCLLWQIPKVIYWHYSKQRREKFDEHLPIVLDQLTSATRAGKSLSQAISDVSTYAPFPISQELGQITNDQKLGFDLATALKSARERIGSSPFNLAVTAMLVNNDLGGNLPQTMQVMSASLKEIWRLDQKLTTSSAEGRKGGVILCVMPIVILLIVLVMQPQLLAQLFSSTVGYLVLVLAVFMYFAGLYWMYRILQVDI